MKNFVYLLTEQQESLVVDPQPDLKPWEKRMHELNAKLVGVLLTHTHFDHVGGVPLICDKYSVPVYVHEADVNRILKKKSLAQKSPDVQNLVRFVKDGDRIPLGNKQIEVLHTPGHSAGECCYKLENALLTGDTVFVGTVGRTDLETGSDEEMFHTIERLKKLPDSTMIYPGHDYGNTPTTTIGREKSESASFQCKTIEELKAIP